MSNESDNDNVEAVVQLLELEVSQRSLLQTVREGLVPENWEIFATLILLSIIFLGAAVIVYLLLWDKQNLHGWTQFSYLASFLLFNVFFLPALFPYIYDPEEFSIVCYLLSVTNQFFFVASKTWLLIIGLDILRKLWKFESTIVHGKYGKRFMYYSLFGWGFPFGMVLSGVILNYYFRNMPFEALQTIDGRDGNLWTLVPSYGRGHCRIPDWAVWEVFVFVNCTIHLLIFIAIVIVIIKHRCQVQAFVERKTTTSQMIVMFLRLFVVVGLSWSYIAVQDLFNAGNINTEQGWGWKVFRGIFFMQGVFISLVCIGNKKTVRQLQGKYPKVKEMLDKWNNFGIQCGLCEGPKLSRKHGSDSSGISVISFLYSKKFTVNAFHIPNSKSYDVEAGHKTFPPDDVYGKVRSLDRCGVIDSTDIAHVNQTVYDYLMHSYSTF